MACIYGRYAHIRKLWIYRRYAHIFRICTISIYAQFLYMEIARIRKLCIRKLCIYGRYVHIFRIYITFLYVHISVYVQFLYMEVANALSKRNLILQESTIQVLGFEHLKDLYETNANFKEAYEACQNPLLRDNSSWLDSNMQEGLFFKGGQLCIPECSMRENLI